MPVLYSWDKPAREGHACMNTVYRKNMPIMMAVRYCSAFLKKVAAFVFINDSSLYAYYLVPAS